MKHHSLAAAAAAVLLLAGCSSRDRYVEPLPTASAPTLSVAARDYAMATASSNMFEIEKSRLALQRSQNAMLRQFAQMMIDDHGRLAADAAPVLRDHGLDPSTMTMSARHRADLQRLQSASPVDFDRLYHDIQVAAHQEALALQRGYAASGDNARLRGLAAQAVPVIESHIAHLRTHGGHMTTVRPGERG